MGKSVLYVGLDVYKMSMDVAIAEASPGAEVRVGNAHLYHVQARRLCH